MARHAGKRRECPRIALFSVYGDPASFDAGDYERLVFDAKEDIRAAKDWVFADQRQAERIGRRGSIHETPHIAEKK
jgi:hypothetical protein